MELAEFLLGRIAEDEAAARAAVSDYCDTEWRVEDGLGVVDQYDSVLVYREGDEQFPAHIARWDPARVLAECEAKRRIVDALGDFRDGYIWASWEASRAEEALLALALPYAEHPDYRDEWTP